MKQGILQSYKINTSQRILNQGRSNKIVLCNSKQLNNISYYKRINDKIDDFSSKHRHKEQDILPTTTGLHG